MVDERELASIGVGFLDRRKLAGLRTENNRSKVLVLCSRCFVGGKGILVTRSSDDTPLTVHLYPTDQTCKSHTVYHLDGTSTSEITWAEPNKTRSVTDTTTGKSVTTHMDENTSAMSFEISPDHHYLVK